MNRFFILTFFLVLLYACKTKNILPPNNSNTQITQKAGVDFFQKIMQEHPYETLKIKGSADINFGSNLPSVSTTLYFEKNTKIWTNISLAFLPIGRALLTSDSVKVYEKINKTYIKSGYNALNEFLGVDFLDIQHTQNLFLGKPCIPLNKKDYSVDSLGGKYTLHSLKNIEIHSGKSQGSYQSTLVFDAQYQLEKISLWEKNQNKTWEINYSERENFIGLNLPKKVKIMIKDKKTKEITLDYNTFEFEKMDTPFSIPSHYKIRDL